MLRKEGLTGGLGIAKKRPVSTEWATSTRELGRNIQRLRVAAGLSQEQVADAAGLSCYIFQQFENGESISTSQLKREWHKTYSASSTESVVLQVNVYA
ncbi:helix-turn-helix transcriptional regulator [Pseudoclavibacter sp. CFCC 11306]|nr:helix-turn-helix transcriptional regulator [Pseudoclavibacter sp. CFCC 11306]